MPNFEYFLSCGIPGGFEGERYKKSPELVKETMKYSPFANWNGVVSGVRQSSQVEDKGLRVTKARPTTMKWGLYEAGNVSRSVIHGYLMFTIGRWFIMARPTSRPWEQ